MISKRASRFTDSFRVSCQESSLCINGTPQQRWVLKRLVVTPLFAYQSVRERKYLPFHTQRSQRNATPTQYPNSTTMILEQQPDGAPVTALSDDAMIDVSPYQAAHLVKVFDVKFSSTEPQIIKLFLKLNVDLSRKSVRGMCQLPYGIGGQSKLMAFCPDEMAPELLAAGADFAGLTAPLERIAAGKVDFDRCIAPPALMPQLMKVARVLGPLKLMPNPKSGTVVTNLKEAVQSAKSGATVEYRAEGQGDLSVKIATTSFHIDQILENIRFFVREILQHRPRAMQGDERTASNLGFVWPPKRYGKESAQTKRNDGDHQFIAYGILHCDSSPPIRINASLLLPQSIGYYR